MNPGFIHLHLHSEYSLVDSTIRIAELVRACVAAGMPAVALTDQSNLFALVKFYQAAEKAGIKPIIGADLWLTDAAEPNAPTRVTLLCQNRAGYLNLSRLLSRCYLEGQHGDHAQAEPAWLAAQNEGLIALLGRESDLGRMIAAGKDAQARAQLLYWQSVFGDRLYIELTRTQHAEESHYFDHAVDLAAGADCPVVASNDVRFLAREEFEAHEARVCIQQGRVLNDPKRPRAYSAEQYLKTPEQMAELFADLPEALINSVELAKRCNLELSFGKYFLPAFPVPAAHTEDSLIRELARAGLDDLMARRPKAPGYVEADYRQRLETELDVIVAMGFPGYFLIVADFIGWAKRNGIPVGPGRGSGAGSLAAWALGITDLDPLRFDLLFERFLNPERVSMPDFDIDFCMDRRDEVIEYVADRYGRDRVCQIITYGTMAAKAVVRDTGRVLGMGYGQVDSIAKLIPNTLEITLAKALKESPELRERYEKEDDVRELIELAMKLEDLTRNAGRHAGGVVIAPSALTDFAPLYCEAGGHHPVSQFDKDDVETIGLVKFDFLGLRTLTIIDWAVRAINVRRGAAGEAPLDIAVLPMNDAATFKLLKSCQTTAIFQLESRGMKELVRKLQPDSFDDIVALVALFRPGPLQSGMVDDFIARKHGRADVAYPHSKLEPVLKPTYGVIVYQEQVMQIAQVLAGYTLGGADLLRRAMGKKKADEMAKERVKFEAGAASAQVDAKRASAIFDLMEKFAEYGFNKSHSAAYALVAYQTAWLKAHYPAEFMAAVLSSDMDNTDKVVVFLDEARALGLNVLPPDVNASEYMFVALPDGRIRYGLGAVKGVGRAVCDAIGDERTRAGGFADLLDLVLRVGTGKLNKRALEALVLSGALDSLGPNRATLMQHLNEAARAAEQVGRDRASGQHDMFGNSAATTAPRLAMIALDEWSLAQRLTGERDTLGHYLSGHPTDSVRALLKPLVTCALGEIEKHYRPNPERRGRAAEQPVTLAGQVVAVRRRGESMAFVQLEDWSGRIEVAFYRDAFVEFGPQLTRDAILVIEGGLALDEFSGGLQLKARAVFDLDQACAKYSRLVQVRLNGITPDFVAALEQVLANYRPGNTPLRLSYRSATGVAEIELGESWRVRARPGLTQALRALDGVIDAELILARPTS